MKKELFSGTFFLVISILVTAAACVSVMEGLPNVFLILFSVSAWLSYGSSKAGEEWVRGIGLGHGTVMALFIMNWVLVGLLTAGGVLTMFATRLFGRYFISGFFHASGLFGSSGGLGDDISGIMSILQRLGSMAYVWLGLFLLVIGAAYAVINILFVRNLMTFSRSLRDSNYSGEWKVEKAECVSKWLFVLGIITCVGVLCVFKDGLAAFVSGCTGAAMIVASRWIKYGVEPASVDEPFSQESEWYSSQQ